MSYTAPNKLLLPMRHSIDTTRDAWVALAAEPVGQLWPSANLAIYTPLAIPARVVVVSLWVATGTGTVGNVDMALYDGSGAAVVSATAGAKTASTEQVFDVTDTVVGPGRYYIGLSASDATTDLFYGGAPAAPLCAAYGMYTETSAYPLPSTATFAIDHTLAMYPIMGVLLETTVT